MSNVDVETVARFVEGDGTDPQRLALADGIRSQFQRVKKLPAYGVGVCSVCGHEVRQCPNLISAGAGALPDTRCTAFTISITFEVLASEGDVDGEDADLRRARRQPVMPCPFRRSAGTDRPAIVPAGV